jgi:phage shock protein PspC (stress-responsive transcriptional regulator)
VSGAVARATNTDPVLWRVLFVVLAFFGGLGILAYIVLWLGTPADGDTASPVEAVFGRGHSSTSSALTVIAGVATVLIFAGTLDNWPWPVVWFLVIAGAIVFAVVVQNRSRGGTPAAFVPSPAPQPAQYPAVDAVTEPIPPVAHGYQPAFAPHGPYASAPPPPVGKPPRPPKPPREHSRLGLLIFSTALVVLGVMGLVELATEVDIQPAAYIAAALAVVGVGLVVGAWLGRARSWIFIGFGLVLALIISTAGGRDDWQSGRNGGGDITWAPTTLSELRSDYEHQFGTATLDLRELDFTGQERTVRVRIQTGDLQVKLPDNVDVLTTTDVRLGNATIFDHDVNGARVDNFTVTDLGDDGAGGGTLHLELDVSLADAEVSR